MEIITKRDILNDIDNAIRTTPDINQIKLTREEGYDFLEQVVDLVNSGELYIKSGEYGNEYHYHDVLITIDSILYG